MGRTLTIARRELTALVAVPLPPLLIIIFLLAAGALTFFVGDFFGRSGADLDPFFRFHPWLYLALAPGLSMRLWAEERQSATLDVLLALPARLSEAIIGKFLAAWSLAGLGLALTFPVWLTANLLGQPDNAVILVGYGASWLMAGALLAIGEAVSAAARTPIVAWLATTAIGFVLVAPGSAGGLALIRHWAPARLVPDVAAATFPGHFIALTRGVLAVPDIVYFLSLMIAALAAAAIIVALTREG
jgi:ABC-2 type transport system permease protein